MYFSVGFVMILLSARLLHSPQLSRWGILSCLVTPFSLYFAQAPFHYPALPLLQIQVPPRRPISRVLYQQPKPQTALTVGQVPGPPEVSVWVVEVEVRYSCIRLVSSQIFHLREASVLLSEKHPANEEISKWSRNLSPENLTNKGLP